MTSSLKPLGNRVLRATVLRAPYVRHCSQTLHQCLLAALKAPEDLTGVQAQVVTLARLLCSIQDAEGGFDIGYQFDFGSVHKRGQATTPEMLCLVALKVARARGVLPAADAARLEQTIQRAEAWLIARARPDEAGRTYIPYCPDSDAALVVNNALSFAAGALGTWPSPQGRGLYDQLVASSVARSAMDPVTGLRVFYYYTTEKRATLGADVRDKIDYYHIAQQLEMHAIAEQHAPVPSQRLLIEGLESTLIRHANGRGLFPLFANVPGAGRLHVWGLASIIPGLIASHAVTGNAHAVDMARRIFVVLRDRAFLGRHFAPVLSADGSHWDVSYYVRSDAWVAHALAAVLPFLTHADAADARRMLGITLQRAHTVNYSGPENHADAPRIRMAMKLLRRVGLG